MEVERRREPGDADVVRGQLIIVFGVDQVVPHPLDLLVDVDEVVAAGEI